MRPILWGLIASVVGAVGWIVFVVFAVLTLGRFALVANLFGLLMLAGLPAGLIGELIRWSKSRR